MGRERLEDGRVLLRRVFNKASVAWIHLAQDDEPMVGSCKHFNKAWSLIKGRNTWANFSLRRTFFREVRYFYCCLVSEFTVKYYYLLLTTNAFIPSGSGATMRLHASYIRSVTLFFIYPPQFLFFSASVSLRFSPQPLVSTSRIQPTFQCLHHWCWQWNTRLLSRVNISSVNSHCLNGATTQKTGISIFLFILTIASVT